MDVGEQVYTRLLIWVSRVRPPHGPLFLESLYRTVAITSTSMRNTVSAKPEQRIRVLTGRLSSGTYLDLIIR